MHSLPFGRLRPHGDAQCRKITVVSPTRRVRGGGASRKTGIPRSELSRAMIPLPPAVRDSRND